MSYLVLGINHDEILKEFTLIDKLVAAVEYSESMGEVAN